MRYLVAFTSTITGGTEFKMFDYKNDALEFIQIHKAKGYAAKLYIEQVSAGLA